MCFIESRHRLELGSFCLSLNSGLQMFGLQMLQFSTRTRRWPAWLSAWNCPLMCMLVQGEALSFLDACWCRERLHFSLMHANAGRGNVFSWCILMQGEAFLFPDACWCRERLPFSLMHADAERGYIFPWCMLICWCRERLPFPWCMLMQGEAVFFLYVHADAGKGFLFPWCMLICWCRERQSFFLMHADTGKGFLFPWCMLVQGEAIFFPDACWYADAGRGFCIICYLQQPPTSAFLDSPSVCK